MMNTAIGKAFLVYNESMSHLVTRAKLEGCRTLVRILRCLLRPYRYLHGEKISKHSGVSREQVSRMLGSIRDS